MKIGIYTPYLDTLTGGEIYILTMAECLSKDNEVDLFWDEENVLEEASERFDLDLSKINLKKNIFSTKSSFINKFKESFKYDKIIYLSDGSVPFVYPGKLIVHFQQPIKEDSVSLKEKSKIKQTKKVICNSEFTKSFVDKTYGIDSEVVYPPAQKIDKSSKKENIILTVGRYQPYKNGSDFKKLNFLINTFNKLHKDYKDWEFYVVTSVKKEDEKVFKENIEDKVAASVKIFKNINHDEISEIYGKSKIYWHAAGFNEDLEEYPERAEHFGMSTVESMSAGCVPIVVNLGGQKEIVENGKNGFLWDTEDQLLSSTIKVIKDKELYRKISKEAENSAKKFGKDRFCREIKAILKR